jgi:pimeloyl-ACP methyl ester carboxylesterase
MIRAHVPSATIVILPGPGHFPQIELAEEVTALIAGFALGDPGI